MENNNNIQDENEFFLEGFEKISRKDVIISYEDLEHEPNSTLKKVKNLIHHALEIIFADRNFSNSFSKNDKSKNLNKENELQNSFTIDLEDLLLDEYQGIKGSSNVSDCKYYILDFYLSKINEKIPKILCERWTISYKEIEASLEHSQLEKRINETLNSIQNITKALPLFKIYQKADSKIDFKFYQKLKNVIFIKKPIKNTIIHDKDLCNLKISVDYISNKHILKYFNETEDEQNLVIKKKSMSICLKKNEKKFFKKALSLSGNKHKESNSETSSNSSISFDRKNFSVNENERDSDLSNSDDSLVFIKDEYDFNANNLKINDLNLSYKNNNTFFIRSLSENSYNNDIVNIDNNQKINNCLDNIVQFNKHKTSIQTTDTNDGLTAYSDSWNKNKNGDSNNSYQKGVLKDYEKKVNNILKEFLEIKNIIENNNNNYNYNKDDELNQKVNNKNNEGFNDFEVL